MMLKKFISVLLFMLLTSAAASPDQNPLVAPEALFPEGRNWFLAGDMVTLVVSVGGENLPVSSLYGVSFVIGYDGQLVEAVDAEAGDFLGEEPVSFNHLDPGETAIAVSAKSGPGSSGSGMVSRARFRIFENVPAGTQIVFGITDITAIDPLGADMTLEGGSTSITVSDGPEIELSATGVDLGEVAIGESASGSFTITNAGDINLMISSIASDNPCFTVDPAEGVVEPEGSLEVSVAFSPVSPGPQSAYVTIASNDLDEGTLTVSLTGKGLLPLVDIDPVIFDSFAAYGLEDASLNNGAEVTDGDVGCNGRKLTLGVRSRVKGNVRAVGDLELFNEARVEGNAAVGGELKLNNKAEITGTVTQEPLAPLEFSVEDFSAGSESVKVDSRKTLDLAPGSYADLKMISRSKLQLHSGAYYFNKIDISTDVEILFDLSQGTVLVYVVDVMEIHNKSEMKINSSEGDANEVFFILGNNSKGKAKPSLISVDVNFLGTVIAPNGRLQVNNKAQVTGALYAKELDLGVDVKLTFSRGELLSGSGGVESTEAASKAHRLQRAFSLSQNYPNPFNPSTTISYMIPEGERVFTSVLVFSSRGQLVRTLVSGLKGPGNNIVYWDGMDDYGRAVSSGVYFYRIQAGDFVKTRKMILLK